MQLLTSGYKKYSSYLRLPNGLTYMNGTLGLISVVENITKYELLETDVQRSFRDLDYGLLNSLIYGALNCLSLNKGALGIAHYLYSRLEHTLLDKSNDQMKRYEALILAVDEMERLSHPESKIVTEKEDLTSEEHLRTLSSSTILLSKMIAKRMYPEISSQLLARINADLLKLWNHDQALFEDQQLRFHVQYCFWKSSSYQNNPFATEAALAALTVEAIHIHKAQQLVPIMLNLDTIVMIQQCNRLYWETNEPVFKCIAKRTIADIAEHIQQIPVEKRDGIQGLSGLGLVTLSHLSAQSITWDEILLLS